jgi:hypothetical protein
MRSGDHSPVSLLGKSCSNAAGLFFLATLLASLKFIQQVKSILNFKVEINFMKKLYDNGSDFFEI